MSWTDRRAIKNIVLLRDKYSVKSFIETGTYKGINALVMRQYFNNLLTIEKNEDYFKEAKKRLGKFKDVLLLKDDSTRVIRRFVPDDEHVIVYLDAHFYDPKAKDKFVVKKELKALKNKKKVVLIIHDFDNNLGHITYDGQPLDFKLLEKYLKKVNPDFHFYTNELDSCQIIVPLTKEINRLAEFSDADIKDIWDSLSYVWSSPDKTYRGILYCLPTKLSEDERKKMGLKQWG